MNEIPEHLAGPQRNEKFAEDCSLSVLLQPFEMAPKQLQLLEAARKNDVTELEKLLTKRVNVNARNNLDRTALHWAAANGNADAIDVLLRAGANVNAADKYDMTPMLLASWFGQVLALENLTQNKKIAMNCFNKQGMNAIHCAAANDHLNVLEFFHTNQFIAKIDINKQELRGKTCLHLAAEKGFDEMVDYLLVVGADPLPTDLTGRTALHLAAAGGHNDVTCSLLQIPGLDINQLDNDLIPRASCETAELLKCLESVGPVGQPEEDGFTALHLASAAGHSAVVQLLMLANADINAQTQKGMSALTLASAGGHLHATSQLLTNSICDRNHQNEDGNTALHLASSINNINIVRLLITKGCDVNVANKLGQTPLHISAESGHSPIVQLLLASRADTTRRDGSGKTPLSLSSRANHVSITDMIIRKERLQNQFLNDPTRYQEDAREEQTVDQEEGRHEDENFEHRQGTRNKQLKHNLETKLQESVGQEQGVRSAALELETSANGVDEPDEVNGYPADHHVKIGDLGDSEDTVESGINEPSGNSNRTGATEVIPRSADAVNVSGRSSPSHSLTAILNSRRRDSGSLNGCYMNTGFSLDEIIELRAGPRRGTVDDRFPVQSEEPRNREDEISVLDSDCFLATSSIVGDGDPKINSTFCETDPAGTSSAVGRTDLEMSSDLASDWRATATDSTHVVLQPKEPYSRNLVRAGSDRSHASGISFQVPECLETESSVFDTSFQEGDMNDPSAPKETIAVRRQSSVDRMSAMKDVLWKLATNQLKEGEWKRMARHWQFTDEQIRAIEHQYTGSKSYRDHSYRMMVIWLECYLEVNPPPSGNPLRGLFDALVAINRRKLAEQIRKKCNKTSDTRKSCIVS